ncbi:MAG: tRNA 4-thiouridine(8) synthase ThiI [Selenomonadales bacterium]|jgi:thiamine biosynthesis/tRNA modification protein thiI|nr:MAG: tRNA 4-thiouridine(8) synthase ThiI [Selenomonadales bacterium]
MHVILVKVGEIHLKGQNRPYFERKLMDNIRNALKGSEARVSIAQSRIYIKNISDSYLNEALERLKGVFGIHAVSPALQVDKDMDVIMNTAVRMLDEAGIREGTFKVKARRADKHFPLQSPEIAVTAGEYILEHTHLKVDVVRPEHLVQIEIREDAAYVYVKEISCAGGMPLGTGGRATLLLSGGIDSPVAGYMIARRGVVIDAVHFHSFPHTSERAKEKVITLAELLSKYCGEIRLNVVPFTKIQEEIYEKCPDKYLTVIMRRYMMKIAEQAARRSGAGALITGESIGQVASQTLNALYCTDEAVKMPVFRPLIGMDKLEIMDIARKIGTYETSILPYEDCCTVFTPRHPATKPGLEKVIEAEMALEEEELIAEALDGIEIIRAGN